MSQFFQMKLSEKTFNVVHFHVRRLGAQNGTVKTTVLKTILNRRNSNNKITNSFNSFNKPV